MADVFKAEPDQLLRVSRHLEDVSSRMKAVVSTLRAQIAGEHQSSAINAGDAQSFWDQLNWVWGSVDAKTNLLDSYSDALRKAADTFEQSDSTATRSSTVTNGAGSLGGGSTPSSQNGMAGSAPAGASPGIGNGGVPAGGAGGTNGVGAPANAAASPASGAASPTAPAGSGAGGGSGGRGSGGSPDGGEPEASSLPRGGSQSQSDAGGEGAGASGATSGIAVGDDSSGDQVTAGVHTDDDANMRLGTNTPERPPDSAMTPPNAGPPPGGARPAPPRRSPPPSPPSPPKRQNPRRAGAPDDPSSPPGPAKDERSRQRSAPSGPSTGRAGVADGNMTRAGDGVARAGHGRPDSEQRSGDTGDSPADALGLAAGDVDPGSDGDGGSDPDDKRAQGEGSPAGSRTDDDDLKGKVR